MRFAWSVAAFFTIVSAHKITCNACMRSSFVSFVGSLGIMRPTVRGAVVTHQRQPASKLPPRNVSGYALL